MIDFPESHAHATHQLHSSTDGSAPLDTSSTHGSVSVNTRHHLALHSSTHASHATHQRFTENYARSKSSPPANATANPKNLSRMRQRIHPCHPPVDHCVVQRTTPTYEMRTIPPGETATHAGLLAGPAVPLHRKCPRHDFLKH